MNVLQKALLANAAFSALSGLSLLILSPNIASLLGLARATDLPGIGLGLLLFAAFVEWGAARPSKKLVQFIIVQDLLWVLASLVVLTFQLFDLLHMGYFIIAIVAVIVGAFAYLQYRYLEWAV